MEFDEEDVEATDPPLSQFLKNNSSHKSKRPMAAYSQLEVLNKEAQETMPTKNWQNESIKVVEIEIKISE